MSPVIPLVTGYLGLVTLLMLFRTTFTDPGVIPRTNSAEGEHMLEREGGSAPRVNHTVASARCYLFLYLFFATATERVATTKNTTAGGFLVD